MDNLYSSDTESEDAVDAIDGSFRDVSLTETASEKALQCAICGQQFKREDNLKRHSKIHLDTPQYHCTYFAV